MGGNEKKSPYRHIYPNYIFYEDIGAARKCRTIPVHFDYEFKINSEPIAEQLMAKCVSRPAVFKENENISEQKAAISELAIYIQENVMIIFEYYRRADNTTFAVPFEWFIIYQYSKAPLPDILFTTLPPQRFGRSPVTHKKFKNRLKYLQNRYVIFIFSIHFSLMIELALVNLDCIYLSWKYSVHRIKKFYFPRVVNFFLVKL